MFSLQVLRYEKKDYGSSKFILKKITEHHLLIMNGTMALESASNVSLSDFRNLLPELNDITEKISKVSASAILDNVDAVNSCLASSPWWTEDVVLSWISSQQLAFDVLVRAFGNIQIVRDMELLVIRFKDSFLYEAVSESSKKLVLNRKSLRYSFSNRRTSLVQTGSSDRLSKPDDSKSTMLQVAVSINEFMDKVLFKSTTCDVNNIPENCFDLLFYSKLFLPVCSSVCDSNDSGSKMEWYRELAAKASTFMSTRFLFRAVDVESSQSLTLGRRGSSIANSSIDEFQILANLETYRRAMVLSMHLQRELVNRSVAKYGVLSSLNSVVFSNDNIEAPHHLSPSAFIHMLLYVLTSDQLPPFMQPQFALSPNAKPFPKSDESDVIIASLHDMVEALTSFQALRKTGIETYYPAEPADDVQDGRKKPYVIRLHDDFEVALKVTVLRQRNKYLR